VATKQRSAPKQVLIGVKDVATMLGLSKSQAWNLVDRQVLSSVYIGRRRLVEMSSVEEFIANLPSERSA
jgi:excisionase family DNA binding protein